MVQDSLKPSLHCAKAAAKANAVLGQISRAVMYRDSNTFVPGAHINRASLNWRKDPGGGT